MIFFRAGVIGQLPIERSWNAPSLSILTPGNGGFRINYAKADGRNSAMFRHLSYIAVNTASRFGTTVACIAAKSL